VAVVGLSDRLGATGRSLRRRTLVGLRARRCRVRRACRRGLRALLSVGRRCRIPSATTWSGHGIAFSEQSLALAWRLHRGLLLGWTAAFVVMGAVFGSVIEAASDIVNDHPQLETLFERVGGQAGLADAYLSAIIGILGLAASRYALQATLRLSSEETAMRAEPLLATAIGRLRWATSHLLFAVVGPAVTLATAGLAAGLTYGLSTGDVGEELPRVLARALVQLSAVWVLAGIAAALFGLLPRLTFLSWAALGAFVLLNLFGEILQLDQWMLDFSPFTHIPDLPGGEYP
jgi:ABC-2 type transport system permease protein